MSSEEDLTVKRLETYASYVPTLILRRAPGGVPPAVRFPAAMLFADIVGSTPLAETFARRYPEGPEGAEELSRLLNAYFERLIRIVTEHGGDIVRFAGDALLACWSTGAGDEDLAQATRHAAQCGLSLQSELADYRTAEGQHLSLRVGIGAGQVLSASVGGARERWEHIVVGDPLDQVSRAQEQAEPGDVVAASEAWSLLRGHCAGRTLAAGGALLEVITDPLPLRPLRPVSPQPAAETVLRSYMPVSILPRIEAGLADWLAELRLVTLLFAKVTGLDYARSEALDRLQSAAHAFQTVLQHYGGSLNRFGVDDKGTVLLAAFGVPECDHEDNALRALRAAHAAQAQLRELGLDSCTGIATGRIFCGSIGTDARREYSLVGDVVNLAARLMSASHNEVLCDQATYRASQGRLSFQMLPRFVLKGKAEPVAVYRAQRGTPQDIRLPPMVGRPAERAILEACLGALESGDSRAVFVEGEAGIGKSRLVADLMEAAAARGVTAWVGPADAIERSTPYHAWRSVFRQLFGLDRLASLEARRVSVLNRLASEPDLPRLAPLLNAVLPLDLPENEITAAMAGEVRADNTRSLLVQLLQAEAAGAPLLLVLEDVHWLDSASWALARQVHKQVHPLLLVVVARPMDGWQLEGYAELKAAAGTQTVLLEAFSADDTRQLLADRLGVAQISALLVDLIHNRAGGNPFFSEELAHDLRDEGKILVVDGICRAAPGARALDSTTLPDSIQGVITSRIDRLTVEQKLTLSVASVIGRTFPARLLWDILKDTHGIEPERAQLDLDALERLDIAPVEAQAPERAHRFKHITTQQVAYGQLLFEQRRTLHRAVAEWYERTHAGDLSPFYPLLAHHWREARVDAKTIDYLEKAGEQALRGFANQETIAFLGEALALDAASETRVDARRRAHWELQLGEAYVNRSDYREGRAHLEGGLRLLGHAVPGSLPGQIVNLLGQMLRQFLHRLWPGRFLGGRSGQPEALLAASRAYERLAEVYYFTNETVLSLIAAFRTLNLAEAAGPSPELARGYAAVGALLGFIPLHRIARGYLDRALHAAREAGQLPAQGFVSLAVGFYYAGVGDWVRAKRHSEKVIEVSGHLGDRRRRDDGLSNLLYIDLFRGDYAAGVRLADELIDSAAHRTDPHMEAAGLQGKANCLLHLGENAEAVACLDRSQALLAGDTGIVGESLRIELDGVLSLARLRRAQAQAALEQATQWVNRVAGTFPSNYGTLPAYAGAAQVALTSWEHLPARADLAKLARKACRAMQSFARVFPIGRPRALLCAGTLAWLEGKPDLAHKTWHEGLLEAERLGMPYDEALCHYEIGRHLNGQDPERAEHLARARQRFEELGARYDAAQAEKELAARG